MTNEYDVWITAVTNSCVTFVAKVVGIQAENETDAAAKAIAHGLEHGLQCVLMIGAPPVPVQPVAVVPFRVEKRTRVGLA